jgi:hypothetical protein
VSLASSRVGFTDRCTIERDANSGTSGTWGQPDSPDWQEHATDQPCKGWTNSGTEPVDDAKLVVLVERRLSLPLGTDVTEADRIGSVTRSGVQVFDGPMDIQAVLTFPDHLELSLEVVR